MNRDRIMALLALYVIALICWIQTMPHHGVWRLIGAVLALAVTPPLFWLIWRCDHREKP